MSPAGAQDPASDLARPPADYFQLPPPAENETTDTEQPASEGQGSFPSFEKFEHLFQPADPGAAPSAPRTGGASLDTPPTVAPQSPDGAGSAATLPKPSPRKPVPPGQEPPLAMPPKAEGPPPRAGAQNDPTTTARRIPAALADSIRVSGFAEDPDYGYTPDAPIRLGGLAEDDWEARRTLLALLLVSDRGTTFEWQALRDCCAFERPGGKGPGKLVIYRVAPPDGRAFRLFIDHFDAGRLYAPQGLAYHPSLETRLAYAAAIAPFNAGRLAEAHETLAPLAAAGHPLARYYRASAAVGLGRAGEIRALYRSAAETGLAPGQFLYGIALEDARAGTPDPAAARQWIDRAAQGRSVDARAYLGYARLTGAGGFPADPPAGAFQLRLAAEQGQAAAQLDYGLARLQGRGIAADPLDGLKWLVLAHRGNHPGAGKLIQQATARLGADALKAANGLADSWRSQMQPPDILLRTARDARRGDAEAMARYARMLFNGVLIDRNLEGSLLYFRLAAQAGHRASVQLARQVAGGLPTSAIERVEAKLKDWKPEG